MSVGTVSPIFESASQSRLFPYIEAASQENRAPKRDARSGQEFCTRPARAVTLDVRADSKTEVQSISVVGPVPQSRMSNRDGIRIYSRVGRHAERVD
jgi:hypothetical protein